MVVATYRQLLDVRLAILATAADACATPPGTDGAHPQMTVDSRRSAAFRTAAPLVVAHRMAVAGPVRTHATWGRPAVAEYAPARPNAEMPIAGCQTAAEVCARTAAQVVRRRKRYSQIPWYGCTISLRRRRHSFPGRTCAAKAARFLAG